MTGGGGDLVASLARSSKLSKLAPYVGTDSMQLDTQENAPREHPGALRHIDPRSRRETKPRFATTT